MATTKKNKKTETEAVDNVAPKPMVRPRQVRLTMGIALLLAGVFICFSIFSYFFTWQTDQDKILSNDHLFDFVFHEDTPVANWAGRMGAAVSHFLVFKGFGLASMVIGLVLTALGLRIIYGRRSTPWFRYFRVVMVVLLIVAPVLTFLFPDAAFSFGGALGNESIHYFNGLIGKTGTGLMLLAITSFSVFVIFSVNLVPVIRKIRLSLPRPKEKIVPEPVSAAVPDVAIASTVYPEAEQPKEELPFAKAPEPQLLSEEDIIANKLKGEIDHLEIARDEVETPTGSLEFTVTEKTPVPVEPSVPMPPLVAPMPSVMTVPDDFELEIKQPQPDVTTTKPDKNRDFELEINIPREEAPAVKEAVEPPPFEEDLVAEEDFAGDDFDDEHFDDEVDEHEMEVIHTPDGKPVTSAIHGSHISIASNEPYAPELDLPDYRFPTIDLLEERAQEAISLDKEELEKNKNQIISTLRSFGIEIQRISATVGPTVTLYEIVPAEGVRISKIRNLEDDIALNLAALGIRIIAPIPGRGTIGIEVPNANKQIVSMRALIASEKFVNSKMSLPVALGKKIDNELYIVDLATMPHLLMAGATGQGKSVGINAILVSLLYKKHPSQLKFVMVDPKKVELSVYKLIEKHFLAKLPNEEDAIITDTKKVIYTLNALCIEMDNRYELLKEAGTRNIKEYNEKFIKRRLNPEHGHKYLPFIVLVVDEFADLIMTAGKEVEMPIARLAQLARAVGIHLIVATQRPSVNVITGTIKANFPGRIAFKVSAKVDSRTILDTGGAEQLIGRGDMLVSHGSEVFRVQCAFVDTPEVEAIVDFIGKQRGYPSAFELPEYEGDEDGGKKEAVDLTNRDKLFEDCARHVVQMQNGSTSNLQRRFNLGYNRAGRIMDQLEAAGVVGPAVGSKPREVYFHTEGELEQYLNESY